MNKITNKVIQVALPLAFAGTLCDNKDSDFMCFDWSPPERGVSCLIITMKIVQIAKLALLAVQVSFAFATIAIFESGTEGYKCFRIPALLRVDDELLAYARWRMRLHAHLSFI